MRMGRHEEARKSLAWALQCDPREIELPSTIPEVEKTSWRELFKYPRSMTSACMVALSQTGGVGILMWITTLFVMVLKITPADASYLMIYVGILGIIGRLVASWMSDALGRRASGFLIGMGGALAMAAAGYWHDAYLGTVSVFFVLIMVQRFFGDASYAIIGPDEHDGHRALADGRGHPLGGLRACIAGHEYPGHAGLEVIGRPVQRPAPGQPALRRQVGSGDHEAAAVPGHHAVQPAGQRRGTDEDEQVLRVDPLGPAGRAVPQRQPLQVLAAVRGGHLGAGPDRDGRDVLDLLDQVVRHRGAQRPAPDQDRHRLGRPGQVDRRLAGRVGAADDVHVLAGAAVRLGEGGAIEDAAPGEFVRARGRQLPVRNAGGQDHGVRADRPAISEPDAAPRPGHLKPDDISGGEHLGAELAGLAPGPVGQLRARDAVREAQVVLDPRALPGLAAGRGALDQDRPQSLGRAVHGGTQAGPPPMMIRS